MQVDALCEVGQGEGVGLAAAVHKLDHVIPAGQLEWSGELAVDRVFYNDVDHRTALVHDGVELVLHLVRPVTAGEGADQSAVLLWEHIAPWGGGDG